MTISLRSGLATADVPRRIWSSNDFFEYPLHASSVVSIGDWPLVAPLMRAAAERSPARRKPPLATVGQIVEALESRGPLTLSEIDLDEVGTKGWDWSEGRKALEYLIWTGEVVCVTRRGWTRVYDLARRAVPERLASREMPYEEALLELVLRSVRAMGLASARDVAEYLRLPVGRAEVLLAQHQALEPMRIRGLEDVFYRTADLDVEVDPPEDLAVVLSPFDNLVWDRRRTELLFGFSHILEAYKPAARRTCGYYTCPVLVGNDLVGRVDVKTDRKKRELIVVGVWTESSSTVARQGIDRAIAELEQRVLPTS